MGFSRICGGVEKLGLSALRRHGDRRGNVLSLESANVYSM